MLIGIMRSEINGTKVLILKGFKKTGLFF